MHSDRQKHSFLEIAQNCILKQNSPPKAAKHEEKNTLLNLSELKNKSAWDRKTEKINSFPHKLDNLYETIIPGLDVPIKHLSHAEKAFRREENSIVGFGLGMAAPLLGNTAWRSKNIRI